MVGVCKKWNYSFQNKEDAINVFSSISDDKPQNNRINKQHPQESITFVNKYKTVALIDNNSIGNSPILVNQQRSFNSLWNYLIQHYSMWNEFELIFGNSKHYITCYKIVHFSLLFIVLLVTKQNPKKQKAKVRTKPPKNSNANHFQNGQWVTSSLYAIIFSST